MQSQTGCHEGVGKVEIQESQRETKGRKKKTETGKTELWK